MITHDFNTPGKFLEIREKVSVSPKVFNSTVIGPQNPLRQQSRNITKVLQRS